MAATLRSAPSSRPAWAKGFVVRLAVPLDDASNAHWSRLQPTNSVLPVPKQPPSVQPFRALVELEAVPKQGETTMYALHMVCRLSGASWTLRRRYRDWERLHDTLASSGELFYLHSLPPKHVKREVSLLRERASALGAYCNELLRRADALSAPPVTEFFEIDEGMWRKACAGGSRKVQQQAALSLQGAARRRRARRIAERRLLAVYSLQASVRNALNERIASRLRRRRRDVAVTVLQAAWRARRARVVAAASRASSRQARTESLGGGGSGRCSARERSSSAPALVRCIVHAAMGGRGAAGAAPGPPFS